MFEDGSKIAAGHSPTSAPTVAGGDCKTGDTIAAVRSAARALFAGARGSHDWDHSCRVYRIGERIAAAEEADVEVVRIAALLHDIGRARQDAAEGRICHARESVRLAAPILADLNLAGSQKENVLHCIAAHRFRGHCPPKTVEARVLFDADKLDAIGAVGVARAFLFAGEVGARLHNPAVKIEETRPYSADDTGYREYRVKLCKIRDRMLTATGRKMAQARHRFMATYFQRFLYEYDGRG
jgi:uncharacterized protein